MPYIGLLIVVLCRFYSFSNTFYLLWINSSYPNILPPSMLFTEIVLLIFCNSLSSEMSLFRPRIKWLCLFDRFLWSALLWSIIILLSCFLAYYFGIPIINYCCVFYIELREIRKALIFLVQRTFRTVIIPGIQLNHTDVIKLNQSFFHLNSLLFIKGQFITVPHKRIKHCPALYINLSSFHRNQ